MEVMDLDHITDHMDIDQDHFIVHVPIMEGILTAGITDQSINSKLE